GLAAELAVPAPHDRERERDPEIDRLPGDADDPDARRARRALARAAEQRFAEAEREGDALGPRDQRLADRRQVVGRGEALVEDLDEVAAHQRGDRIRAAPLRGAAR